MTPAHCASVLRPGLFEGQRIWLTVGGGCSGSGNGRCVAHELAALGAHVPISGPVACLRRVRPEAAACKAGSLNDLKIKAGRQWAWPPMVFDNPVAKVQAMLALMNELNIHPEFECFDVGIVRNVGMYLQAGMFSGAPELNFLMGVASGMPCDAELLALLPRYAPPGALWQTTLIGRAEF